MISAELPEELFELLSELAVESDLSREAIEELIASYPNYRDHILRFAIDWHSNTELEYDDEVAPLPAILLPSRSGAAIVDPFAGKTPADLKATARDCDIPLSILSKLEERTIKLETIPLLLIQRLAATLEKPVDVLLGFLELDPTLSSSASYRSDQMPHVGGKIDFATAIRNTPMDDTQRARWLALSE
jgi:hypothetical protein